MISALPKEGLDFIRILFFLVVVCCLARIWHISGSNKRISQRQTRLRRGRPVEGLGNLRGAGDGLLFSNRRCHRESEREGEPW